MRIRIRSTSIKRLIKVIKCLCLCPMMRIRIIRYGSGSGSNNLKKICYEFGSRTYDNFHTNPDQDKIALIGTYSLTQRYGSKSCMDPRGGKKWKLLLKEKSCPTTSHCKNTLRANLIVFLHCKSVFTQISFPYQWVIISESGSGSPWSIIGIWDPDAH